MKAFADLYLRLDASTSNNTRIEAMAAYFVSASAADSAWAVYFLAGGKPRQLVPSKVLREFALRVSAMPAWLFEESYQAVGDLAETIALLSPDPALPGDPSIEPLGLAYWLEHRLLPLRGQPPESVLERLAGYWRELDANGRFVCGKLVTGSFRVGVSRLLVTRALAQASGVDAKRIAERLVGYTDLQARPSPQAFADLIAVDGQGAGPPSRGTQPYPFFLAHPLQAPPEQFDQLLGPATDWLVEWKWDGIRAQIVHREGAVAVWSRGEELVTQRFPELAEMARLLPEGTVIDGEVIAWRDDKVQPFARLQQRLGRKLLSARLLTDNPVALIAYDVLEWRGEDWRSRPQHERREQLEALVEVVGSPALRLSPALSATTWSELAIQREDARRLGVEGMMLKARAARYGVGRTKDVGVWWKWKIDPLSVDAVLIYAQRGHGRRAGLYSDYTFAVWDQPPEVTTRQLVPFAKAYSGLTDVEMKEVDAVIRRTTIETFGPVRSVAPTLVFELGFEGIARSPRHKSGIAVRFPRMLRRRLDKPVTEADTLATLEALLL